MTGINEAKESLWNNDIMSALNSVGSGEVSLLEITVALPTEENEE